MPAFISYKYVSKTILLSLSKITSCRFYAFLLNKVKKKSFLEKEQIKHVFFQSLIETSTVFKIK